MIVYINNEPVRLFEGARAGDAVLAYSRHSFAMLGNGKLELTDRFGNPTEPDGPVTHGQKFQLKRTRQP